MFEATTAKETCFKTTKPPLPTPNVLFNQRMEAFGEGYLQELLGDAIIRNK